MGALPVTVSNIKGMTCRISSPQLGPKQLLLQLEQKREAIEVLKKEMEILCIQGHTELAKAKFQEAVDLLDEEKLLMIEIFRRYREQIYEKGKRTKHIPTSQSLRMPSCPAQVKVVTAGLPPC